MNTISPAMLDELCDLLKRANKDPEARVVVLTGTGRSFCAGLDFASVMGDKKRVTRWFLPNPLKGTSLSAMKP